MELTQEKIQALVATFLEAFLRGQAIEKLNIQVTRDTDFDALTQGLLPEGVEKQLTDLFSGTEADAKLVEKLDALIDANEEVLEPLREYFFDLIMLNLILTASEIHGEEYLDSPEWLAMEEQSLDRGTELLNLMIYLRDCHENRLGPNLEDFLDEFLLVTDDQFQDEFFIYEDLIRQQRLIDGPDEAIFDAGRKVESEELEEVFVPFLLFFKFLVNSNRATLTRVYNQSPNRGVTAGLFQLLKHFYMLEESGGN